MDKFKDVAAERNVIGSLLSIGKNAFIECDSIISSEDFTLSVNKALFQCVSELFAENDQLDKFDIELIKNKASQLSLLNIIDNKQVNEYLELIKSTNISLEAVRMLAFQVKKMSIIRALYDRYSGAKLYLEKIDGSESLSDILSKAEGLISDFMSGANTDKSWENLADELDSRIEYLLSCEPVTQIGIPTGFSQWDDAIGGGPRKGTISVIGARSKVGKSWMALNQAINIAKLNIPTLYLDTELTKDYQQSRMICIESKCPIRMFESGQFAKSKEFREKVLGSRDTLNNIPLDYKSISGMNYTEAMSIIRQWIVKKVGFNDQGKANECCIIYDYFKLTDGSALTKATPEYILLGLMLTSLHDFAVKYEVPIVGYVQLNRDGIEGNDTNIVAGSDRILWLSSSLSFMKNKTEDDAQLGCGFEFGNKKLYVAATRHGGGLSTEVDYINLHSSLFPNVDKYAACGYIKEGLTYTNILTARSTNERNNEK
jgi:replicative DNA helicase